MDVTDTSIEHTPSITNSSRKRTRKSTQRSAKKYCPAPTSESTHLDTCTLDNVDANVLTPYRKRSLRGQSSPDLKSSPQQSFSEGEVSVAMDCLLKTPTSESFSHNNQPSTELSDSSPQCDVSSIPLNISACHETETCSTYQSETSDYKTDASQETKVSDDQPEEASDQEPKISDPESETLNVHTEASVDKMNAITKSVDESTTLESAANSASVSLIPDIPVESESDNDLPQVDFSGQNCSTYQSETSDYKTDASQETKVSDDQPETSDQEHKISVPESETFNVHTEASVDKTDAITKSVDESTTLESAANSASVSPIPDIPVESESDDDLPQVDFSGQNWTRMYSCFVSYFYIMY